MAAVPIKKSNVVEFWQKKTVSAAWQATTIEEVDGRVTGTFLKKIAQTVQFCRIYVLHNTTFTVKKSCPIHKSPKDKRSSVGENSTNLVTLVDDESKP
jgi:hypothetical protein